MNTEKTNKEFLSSLDEQLKFSYKKTKKAFEEYQECLTEYLRLSTMSKMLKTRQVKLPNFDSYEFLFKYFIIETGRNVVGKIFTRPDAVEFFITKSAFPLFKKLEPALNDEQSKKRIESKVSKILDQAQKDGFLTKRYRNNGQKEVKEYLWHVITLSKYNEEEINLIISQRL